MVPPLTGFSRLLEGRDGRSECSTAMADVDRVLALGQHRSVHFSYLIFMIYFTRDEAKGHEVKRLAKVTEFLGERSWDLSTDCLVPSF